MKDESGRDLRQKLKPPSFIGVLFCLISMFTFICASVSFNLNGVTLICCLALVIFYSAIGTGEGSAWERSYPSTTFLAPIFVGSFLIPLYIGVKIYVGIYAPYSLAMTGRKYTDVPFDGKPHEYADAGIVKFASDTTLDTSKAFGYKGDDFTYCAAPVTSRTDSVHPMSAGPKVTFWAVGLDCCGNRRDFECDGAGETEVKNAFTINELPKTTITDILVPRSKREFYMKSVRAAMALHNLYSDPDDVILVRWAAEPEVTLLVWLNRAIITCVTTCLAYAVVVTFLWTAIHVHHTSVVSEAVKGSGSPRGRSGP